MSIHGFELTLNDKINTISRMKFAIVEGEKKEAVKGFKGSCPICQADMIARCGVVKIHHWAHKTKRVCDTWWENETEWHRSWKNQFPESWQEVVQHDQNGEKHIADVKTATGWVIEFQHSYILPEEKKSRTQFYKNLVWVVDGKRRKRDEAQMLKAVEDAKPIKFKDYTIYEVDFAEQYAVLRDWLDTPAAIFFDLGTDQLWCLLPHKIGDDRFLVQVNRDLFIALHTTENGYVSLHEVFRHNILSYFDFKKRRTGESQRQLKANLLKRHSVKRRNRRF